MDRADAECPDPQSGLYDRFVRRGEPFDQFSAKRLYPGLSLAEAVKRIERLRRVYEQSQGNGGKP